MVKEPLGFTHPQWRLVVSLICIFCGAVLLFGRHYYSVRMAHAISTTTSVSAHNSRAHQNRRLQFDGMFDVNPNQKKRKRIGGGGLGGGGGDKLSPAKFRMNRPAQLTQFVDEIMMGMDRYHQWWMGPAESTSFLPQSWSSSHVASNNAIFTFAAPATTAVTANYGPPPITSPRDFLLFLGSARRVFTGDIVLAMDAETLRTYSNPQVTTAGSSGGGKDAFINLTQALIDYGVIVYVLPSDLCSVETVSIFCGSSDERVPSSVFRFFSFCVD